MKIKSRKRIPMGRSQRVFSRTAKKTHPKNISIRPMRGGIRL